MKPSQVAPGVGGVTLNYLLAILSSFVAESETDSGLYTILSCAGYDNPQDAVI